MRVSTKRESYFRSDIQGLRGIAVLLVVVYHTGFAFPGGFIGVDMFFVISGFVITQVLMREYEETGKISLSQFYARRARRLVPALSVVTIFTLLISMVAMSPFGEQQQIIKTALASTFFAGNIHLFAMNSYEALKDNPLRHLWSLGVEEQFYWVYPILLIGVLQIARKRFFSTLTIVLSIFSATSLVICVLLTRGFEFGYTTGSTLSSKFSFLAKIGFEPGGDWPAKFAFFGAPARFWEILAGAITALVAKKFTIKFFANASFLVTLSIGALVWTSVTLNSRSAFPGLLALAPVLATVVMIFFNQQVGFVNRTLTSRPMVYLGDISYSLYLWHWPLIVFSRVIWPGTTIAPLIAATVSFSPAIASFRVIESHHKPPKELSNLRTLRLMSLFVLFSLLLSLMAFRAANSGLGIPFPESKFMNFATQNNCGDGSERWEIDCLFGQTNPSFTVVLIGDSNARSASDGVFDAVRSLGGELFISVTSGCPMIDNAVEPDCQKLNQGRLQKLKTLEPDIVILVSNYSAYVSDFSEEQITQAFERTIARLHESRIPVVVQGQIPDCYFSRSLIKVLTKKIYDCGISLFEQSARLRLFNATQIITMNIDENVFLDATEFICPESDCRSLRNGKWIYSDANHLSPTGSKILTAAYVEAIKKVLEQKKN
jgi:peptidoglycan/LPS O-acetylase OafA/YrhL